MDQDNDNGARNARGTTLPDLAPALRRRAYAYGFGLFAEVVLIVGCFCWMSEAEPCKVQEGVQTTIEPQDGQQLSEGASPGLPAQQVPRQPCNEATYLFCVFYLGLAKDLAFFVAGLKTEHLSDVPERIRSIFVQYVGSLCFFGLASAVASVMYILQPTEHMPRKVLYVAAGALPNAITAFDCVMQAAVAWKNGYRALFPNVQEIKPFKYEELDDKNVATTWYLKECSICLDNFDDEDSVVRLPCGHLFHTDCVVGWLRQTMTCPVRCRLGFFIVALPPGDLVETNMSGDGESDESVARNAPPAQDPRPAARDPEADEERRADGDPQPGQWPVDEESPLTPVALPQSQRQPQPPHTRPSVLGDAGSGGRLGGGQARRGEDHSNEVPPVMFGVPDYSQDIPFVD
mmetsp:Transcript_1043/g.2688  ORF Transcript_1043/g.2688 Transcript_1043/m.2688 type:complete len:403 (+) Transcript_1043:123-1331(+)|eukprot:CAMPEP_0176300926 /NCGR_PEP_ID=MMETSP0121_2-20121125/60586_1 /TAXON_ID=160619 /ORGANISM="Kryptoperidinium foliaceum, Strain CCMP 1326" /LENGTH=402 /DNA_ID=CAMNT_0017642355 /DNA_START=31 /DNA_END=1239 /DNA_ORIENTATION=-